MLMDLQILMNDQYIKMSPYNRIHIKFTEPLTYKVWNGKAEEQGFQILLNAVQGILSRKQSVDTVESQNKPVIEKESSRPASLCEGVSSRN